LNIATNTSEDNVGYARMRSTSKFQIPSVLVALTNQATVRPSFSTPIAAYLFT